jgi:hypothetical protein
MTRVGSRSQRSHSRASSNENTPVSPASRARDRMALSSVTIAVAAPVAKLDSTSRSARF